LECGVRAGQLHERLRGRHCSLELTSRCACVRVDPGGKHQEHSYNDHHDHHDHQPDDQACPPATEVPSILIQCDLQACEKCSRARSARNATVFPIGRVTSLLGSAKPSNWGLQGVYPRSRAKVSGNMRSAGRAASGVCARDGRSPRVTSVTAGAIVAYAPLSTSPRLPERGALPESTRRLSSPTASPASVTTPALRRGALEVRATCSTVTASQPQREQRRLRRTTRPHHRSKIGMMVSESTS
jgi:hypothetical protein